MQCPRCRHENPPESNFCLGCGARLGLRCAACGNELPAGSRFCNKCGQPTTAQADSERRFASPEIYTPRHHALDGPVGAGQASRAWKMPISCYGPATALRRTRTN